MKFIIQYNMMNDESLQKIRDAVQPYPHQFVGVIPFSHEITADDPITGIDYIPYGSTLMTNIGKGLGWTGLHFDLSTFNYSAAVENRDDMLNDGLLLPLTDIILHLKENDPDQDVFIRPSEDLKQFSGQVIKSKECYEWLQDAMECASSGSSQLAPDTMIVVDNVKSIQAEWRWFIVDGKIIDGSMYRAHGQLIKKHETDSVVIDQAQEFANMWLPDPCCVMDLALVDDEVKVIEFNCINSSGTYNHDTNRIFAALWDYHQ